MACLVPPSALGWEGATWARRGGTEEQSVVGNPTYCRQNTLPHSAPSNLPSSGLFKIQLPQSLLKPTATNTTQLQHTHGQFPDKLAHTSVLSILYSQKFPENRVPIFSFQVRRTVFFIFADWSSNLELLGQAASKILLLPL